MTFSNEAFSGSMSATSLSCSCREALISRLVSARTDEGVAVNFGGGCGGFRRDVGAIATDVMGLWKLAEATDGLVG